MGSILAFIFPNLRAEEKPTKTEKSKSKPKPVSVAKLSFLNIPTQIFQVGKEYKMRLIINPEELKSFKKMRIACLSHNRESLDGSLVFESDIPKWRRPDPKDENVQQYVDTYSPKLDVEFSVNKNEIHIPVKFLSEGEYNFLIFDDFKEGVREKKALQSFRVYALEEDIFNLRPYKGDVHMHTTYSDGKNTIEEMAVKCLERGLDYQAMSDHHCYEASADLIKKLEDVPTSLSAFTAEEVHASSVHVHSFGAQQSVTKLIADNLEAFKQRIAQIEKTLPQDMFYMDKRDIAEAEAAFEYVRKAGGMAIFNHPYWRKVSLTLHLRDAVIDSLFERANFDAVEFINGSIGDDRTDLCLAQYCRILSKNKKVRIIGNSDAHYLRKVANGYTIAFAKSKSLADIKDAIMNFKNVAVDNRPVGYVDSTEAGKNTFTHPEIFGDMRYVKYSNFLISNFYEKHDELCRLESEVLDKYFKQEASKEDISAKKSALDRYVSLFWAK